MSRANATPYVYAPHAYVHVPHLHVAHAYTYLHTSSCAYTSATASLFVNVQSYVYVSGWVEVACAWVDA